MEHEIEFENLEDFEEHNDKMREEGAKAEGERIFAELNKNSVDCAGMSKDFIAGSNWCNGLWKSFFKELKEDLKNENRS